MSITRLTAEQVRRTADPQSFAFETTAELSPSDEVFGQPRALRAIDFGIHMTSPGYNIFIVGGPGTGRTPAIQNYLAKHAPSEPTPSDWAYVHNFADAYQPIALQLNRSKGREFANKVDALMMQVQTQLPRAFESEAYDNAHGSIESQLDTLRAGIEAQLQAEAKLRRTLLQNTPSGYRVVPAARGRALTDAAVTKLTKAARANFEKAIAEMNTLLEDALRQLRDAERQALVQYASLDAQVAMAIAQPLIADLKREFADELPPVADYLTAMEADLVANVAVFKPDGDEETASQTAPPLKSATGMTLPRAAWLNRYRVNVLVDNCDACGAPVINEDNPTYQNLFGKIEHNATANGMMMTDHMMLRPGAMHRANGGFLVLRAGDLYQQYNSWNGLKRSLLRGEIKIDEPGGQSLPVPSIQPQPIPLRVKVALLGEYTEYWMGYSDEDFRSLFKVRAELSDQMDRTPQNELEYAQFLCTRCHTENLLPFDRTAVAKLIEFGSRYVEDQKKLTTRFGKVADVAREASFWATRGKRPVVTGEDIRYAVNEYHFRWGLSEENAHERIERGLYALQTEGDVVGQINGLSYVGNGEHDFGEPFRITARSYVGRGGINDIERGVSYTDSTHNKGMAIIDSYLTGLYSVEQALQITATTAFEQSYTSTSGDSASCALLCAMLSAVGNIPITQTAAMTGTLDQFGNVMPIGGVNSKIEGWFDILKSRNQIDGQHGVVIPSKNKDDLMLREDVVEAVRAEKFHVVVMDHISDAVEIMMGEPAGVRGEDGKFPEESVNGRVEAALKEINEKLEGKRDKDEGNKPKDDVKAAEPESGPTLPSPDEPLTPPEPPQPPDKPGDGEPPPSGPPAGGPPPSEPLGPATSAAA